MGDEVLATVSASAARRWMGVVTLGIVGGLLIYAALSSAPSFAWRAFLVASGCLALWSAVQMRRVTEHAIELTATELRDSSGKCIVMIANIDTLDRGFFAFKPSNGFLIRSRTPGSRVWRPGMWWRFGRRIGIGGVMPAPQTKMMSETLALLIADQDSQDSQQT